MLCLDHFPPSSNLRTEHQRFSMVEEIFVVGGILQISSILLSIDRIRVQACFSFSFAIFFISSTPQTVRHPNPVFDTFPRIRNLVRYCWFYWKIFFFYLQIFLSILFFYRFSRAVTSAPVKFLCILYSGCLVFLEITAQNNVLDNTFSENSSLFYLRFFQR